VARMPDTPELAGHRAVITSVMAAPESDRFPMIHCTPMAAVVEALSWVAWQRVLGGVRPGWGAAASGTAGVVERGGR